MVGAAFVHGEGSYDDDGVVVAVVVDNNADVVVVASILDAEEPFSGPSLPLHSLYEYPVVIVDFHQSAEQLLHQCCGFARDPEPLDTYLSWRKIVE